MQGKKKTDFEIVRRQFAFSYVAFRNLCNNTVAIARYIFTYWKLHHNQKAYKKN